MSYDLSKTFPTKESFKENMDFFAYPKGKIRYWYGDPRTGKSVARRTLLQWYPSNR